MNPSANLIPEILRKYIKLYPKCKEIYVHDITRYEKEKKLTNLYDRRISRLDEHEKLKPKVSSICEYISTYKKECNEKLTDRVFITYKEFHLFSTTDLEYPLVVLIFRPIGHLQHCMLCLLKNMEDFNYLYGNIKSDKL